MATTTLTKAQVISMTRRRAGDSLTSTIDTFVADGTQVGFELTNYPCEPSDYSVYVNGAVQTETTDYTMDDGGLVSFIVGSIPSLGDTVEVRYKFTKLTDDETWAYITDALPLVHMLYDFGYSINDAYDNFTDNPSTTAGACYATQAAILIIEDISMPLVGDTGIMIQHGDETIDTKTIARNKIEKIKGLTESLQKMIDRYIIYGNEPYLRL